MVVFKELPLPAAVARVAHKRALALIPFPNPALHPSRDVAPPGRLPRLAWLLRRGELALLEFLDERIEGALDYGRDVARRQAMTQQLLRPLQLVARAPVDRDLQGKAVSGERSGPGNGILAPGRACGRRRCGPVSKRLPDQGSCERALAFNWFRSQFPHRLGG